MRGDSEQLGETAATAPGRDDHPAPVNAVAVSGLDKTYRPQARGQSGKQALRGVDLTIPRGSLFALLGPNGAGKSTLINVLGGLVMKTGGAARIWDFDIDVNPRQARAAIGIVPQELNLDPFFTPRELLVMQAGLYGVPRPERYTQSLLETVGLDDKADSYARSLSGGMRRRLMVAKAMVHRPPVLVLDEPTAGVDIELRQQLWRHVRTLNAQGTTVLLTTHYLEEAQELCDTVAIINNGQVVACDSTEALLARIDSKELRIELARPVDAVPAGLAGYQAELRRSGRCIAVRYRPSEAPAGRVLAAVQEAGLEIADVSSDDADLEDIFLQITRSG